MGFHKNGFMGMRIINYNTAGKSSGLFLELQSFYRLRLLMVVIKLTV